MSANMGGKSTSQGAVSGSGAARHSYDLLSWQGVAEMLKDGREHITDPLAYAEFRDLVLAYSRSGGDKELKTKLDGIVATFGEPASHTQDEVEEPKPQKQEVVEKKLKVQEVSHIQEPSTEPEKQNGMIGRTRATPSFMPVSLPNAETDAQEKAEKPVEQSQPASSATPDPVQQEPVATEEPLKPQKEIEPEVVEKKPKPVSVPTPTPVPEESQPEHHDGMVSVDEYRKRIAEIKREVTEKIGNPAALVDTHNELGKQYMTALLTALKALTPGGPVGIQRAMGDLEVAYKKLLEVDTFGEDDEHSEKETPSVPEPEVQPPVVEEQVHEEVTPEVEIPQVIPEEVPKENEATTPIEELDTAPRNIPIVETPVIQRSVQPESEPQEPVTPPIPRAPVKRTPGSVIESLKNDESETEVPVEASKAPVPPTQFSAQSLESDTPVPGSIKTTVQQSELASPEINKALHDLLDEWPLFAGSGLFGIGPGGMEHPLYKQLSMLSMGEIMAGRWDKADPKVIRVLKEYVNAWRHEQGVAYTINETFEHYLRRVVQRILKRQRAGESGNIE